jgi:hypothetical protein
MTKQVNYFFTCILAALMVGSAFAAEEAPEATENSSAVNTDEIVLNQAEDIVDVESELDRPEGDDDFIPSTQISEDLSVSFPVDI